MRQAARVNGNHTEIVDCLVALGCLVQSLAAVGRGVPDLLVCTPRGRLLLLEVKDGRKPPSKRTRTAQQVLWHARWAHCATLWVVFCEADASEAVRLADAA
jgi:hypothetical protein